MTMRAYRMLSPGLRSVTTRRPVIPARRSFSTSPSVREAAGSTLPTKKPVGAFRGGIFGFLTGTIVAGASVYYYILGEYRVTNEMLAEDIYALQAATQKLQTYIGELETKVDQLRKK
ncbi:hypothetical protein BDV23DRAFT_159774 [Aspergillus alliaceus]|uniref:Uncharacterized protein n=1 Tax=Petromyces alliaceus TaxID=209559 RepID=A0A5N7C1X7_PETAA|nr:uncharacterized protein BDW43DRAFT_271381 [Aspergillus alliaceus]KAB8235240.1 hypothetical protein BDW43DRAFT_271381 [Aspergillus alliaceus]KAE8388094.1 hypothetical protein BDV23DRAFT_159774 [Aspergillus alliaceus]